MTILRIQATSKEPANVEVRLQFVTTPTKPARGDLSADIGDLCLRRSFRAGDPQRPGRLAISLGPRATCTAETVRRAAGKAARWLMCHRVRRASVDGKEIEKLGIDGARHALCEGLSLGAFRFDRHKSRKPPTTSPTVHFVLSGDKSAAIEVRRAAGLSDAVNLARTWGHEPPNVVNPVSLSERLTLFAEKHRLACRVYDEDELAGMGAEALLSVGVASKTPPRLIVLEYGCESVDEKNRPVVLVGKAVTFDTGGYSLKDREGIVGMKYDKCGAMAVVGAMQAVASLKLESPVIGIIAAAENMISGAAYRPNDIVKTMSGRTVEIISTDAEGRMVLADALTFAQKTYRPRALIDLATLTGGVVVALGAVRAGLMANDDRLADALKSSGERVHERLWRLPLDDDYLELIKGDDSDLKNSGGRAAHPIIGGLFLKQFVDKRVPWAHLDIAGTATCEKDQPYCPKGATGFGVRLLTDYIERLPERDG